MVASLHDLTFEHHPEWFTRGRRLSYTVQARWAARTAGALLTGSQAVADDIMATYDVPASRITVTAYPVDETFGPGRDGSAALERLGATPPYIVAMGGSPRRRLDVALDAWRAVRAEHQVDLVVVGTDDIPREAGVSGGWLEDDEWAGVLAGAEALVYPTEYEGFGFPALEAIASGTPVVCARVGSLPEVLGDAAAWCGVADAEGTARELTRLLTTPAWAEELRAAGLARAAACPSWSEVADGFMEAYQRAAGS
jgi:alpha-1,3-rhamnosyl/mannosyltransferase